MIAIAASGSTTAAYAPASQSRMVSFVSSVMLRCAEHMQDRRDGMDQPVPPERFGMIAETHRESVARPR